MGFDVGTHRVKAVHAVLGKTSKGNEQIGIQFQDTLDDQMNITWYGYFSDAAFDRTIKALRLLGWKGTDLFEFRNGLPQGCDQEVDIVVDDEEYEGKTHRKVKWVNDPNSGGVAVKDVMDEREARGFAARMKAKVAALHAGNGGAAPAKAAPKQAAKSKPAPMPRPNDADDIFGDEPPI